MRNRLVVDPVSGLSSALMALVMEKRTLVRGALCLAEAWLCTNIYEPSGIIVTLLLRGVE
jgi:hypothetical protein